MKLAGDGTFTSSRPIGSVLCPGHHLTAVRLSDHVTQPERHNHSLLGSLQEVHTPASGESNHH